MSSRQNDRIPLLARPVVVGMLACVSTLALGASVLLALSPSRLVSSPEAANLLLVFNTALSSAALTVALASARSLFSRRKRNDERWITVCAWTRRVEWQGHWISFEEYLAKRFNLRCTHGICAEAAEQMRRDAAKFNVGSELRQS